MATTGCKAITAVVHRAITLLGITLALSVLLVVGNSIRLDIENRREEIEVAKLIGATNRFVRRPFLYGGMWYGLLGGALALGLVLIVLFVIEQPVQHLIGLYHSNFELIFPDLKQSLALIATSIALGCLGLGSWTSHRQDRAQLNARAGAVRSRRIGVAVQLPLSSAGLPSHTALDLDNSLK